MAKQQKKKYYQRMTGKLMLQIDPAKIHAVKQERNN